MLLDSFKDIIKHTNSLGFIDMVKIVGTATDAKIEALDADKTVVIFGTMYQPIAGIDSVVGLSRIPVLKSFIDFPPFSDPKAKTDIVTESRPGGATVPTGIKFDSGKSTANYRFMGEAMVNEQIKVPPFKGATWNVVITPEKKKITELSYMQGALGSLEKRFTVSVDSKNTLVFAVGSGPADKMDISFADNVTGTLKHQWSWPLSQVLSILKLTETATATMSFSDMGVMKIDVDSGIGKYTYLLPAGKA